MNNKFTNKLSGNIYHIGKALDMYIPVLTERAEYFKERRKEKKSMKDIIRVIWKYLDNLRAF